MGRYLRLYKHFLIFSLSKSMEFRLDFWFRVLMDGAFYVVNILFFKIVLDHTDVLAGWSETQVMVFVGAYLLVDALFMTIFANNTWQFAELVYKGGLDYYLVRPVSSLFFLSLREFAPNSFVNLLMALGILCWALWNYPEPLSPFQLCLFALLIFNGLLLYFVCRMLTLFVVFWTQAPRGMDSLFYSLTKFMERPDGIYYGWLRIVLTTIMPFALMASFPCRSLFEVLDAGTLAHIIGASTAMYALLLYVWDKALRAYASASS